MNRKYLPAPIVALCLVAAIAWSQYPDRPASQQCYPDPNPLAGLYYFHEGDIQQMAANEGRLFVLVRERSGRASLWEYNYWGKVKPEWTQISTAKPKAEAE